VVIELMKLMKQVSRDNAVQEIREDVLAKMKGLQLSVNCT